MYKKLIELPGVDLNIQSKSNLDKIIGYGSRINNKRSFLFISKVLGKHIPVSPRQLINTHKKLAKIVNPVVKKDNVLVIGLAETAIGLGWGVFEQIKTQSKFYIHTTRVLLNESPLLDFEEEHSHATEQYLYTPKIKTFNKDNITHVVIVDDEITTGNTINNLIVQLRKEFKNSKISALTLLNWTNFQKKYSIYSLEEGSFSYKEKEKIAEQALSSKVVKKTKLPRSLANKFGRVGAGEFPAISKILISKFQKIRNSKILLLGTGEFMHYPLVVSAYFHNSNRIKIQSTSRSPVMIGGSIKSKLVFKDNYYPDVYNYLYNVIDKKYDIVFIFYEKKSKFDFLLHDQLSVKFKKVIPIYI